MTTQTTATEDATSPEEQARRQRRKDAYHLAAGRNRLPLDVDETDFLFRFLVEGSSSSSKSRGVLSAAVLKRKADLIRELAVSRGESDTSTFNKVLHELTSVYDPSQLDVRDRKNLTLGGMWLTLTKPKYPDCLGLNDNQEYMYTLGRMSFRMFNPDSLVCSIQGTFNPIHYVSRRDREAIQCVPQSLKSELKQGFTVLRTYDIVTACTIEPRSCDTDFKSAANRGVSSKVKALLTTYGYALPDTIDCSRLSIWFTGGSIEVNDADMDMPVWETLFRKQSFSDTGGRRSQTNDVSPPMEMESDGKVSYSLKNLVGGHGVAYVDILYLDETLKIVRGSAGDIVVFARCPHFPDE